MEMPLDTYHVEMNWPQVPVDLCEDVLSTLTVSTRLQKQAWQVPDTEPAFQMHHAPQVLIDWCKDNLPIDLSEFTVAVQVVNRNTHNIHQDNDVRDSSYNFIIKSGEGITRWYNDKREELHEFVYAERTWYQHQGKVLHGVTNISPPRVAITLFKNKWTEADYEYHRKRWIQHQSSQL